MWLVRLMLGVLLSVWTAIALGQLSRAVLPAGVWAVAVGIVAYIAFFAIYLKMAERTNEVAGSVAAVIFGGLIFVAGGLTALGALVPPLLFFLVGRVWLPYTPVPPRPAANAHVPEMFDD